MPPYKVEHRPDIFREILWRGESKSGAEYFDIDGVAFVNEPNDCTRKTTEELVAVIKPHSYLEKYIEIFSAFPCNRILEFGMWEGGSALLFASLLKPLEKIVSIDLKAPNIVFDRLVRRVGYGKIIRPYYEVDQASPVVREIVKKEFSGSPDIIIDDCSHLYAHTKVSFQLTFPLLAPGGLYIIEDWAWAHLPAFKDSEHFAGQPPMTNFIAELLVLYASRGGWIKTITVCGGMVIIEKGIKDIPENLNIDSELYFI